MQAILFHPLARRVIDLCGQVSRPVPDSIAVLGVDDDPLLCQLATPPLSSVIPDAEGAGYTAAEQLDAIMSGRKIKPTGTLLPPLGIATRQSTDTLAVEDRHVTKAARYILAHACEGIQGADVVKQTNLTRRALETRFKRALGKTPHALITATRLAKAERLLRETRRPWPMIEPLRLGPRVCTTRVNTALIKVIVSGEAGLCN